MIRTAAVLFLSYVLLVAAILSDLFNLGPNSLLLRSISFGLPVLIAAVYLPDWAMLMVSGGVLISWTGSAVWRNSTGSGVAVFDARLLDLYPLPILLVLAFLVHTVVGRRRRREAERDRVDNVRRILERKPTRDDVAEEFLAQTMPLLRAFTGLLWFTDPSAHEFQLVAEVGIGPAWYPRLARVSLSTFGLVNSPTEDTPLFVLDPTKLKEGSPLALLMKESEMRSAYLFPLLDAQQLVGVGMFLRITSAPTPQATRRFAHAIARAATSYLVSRPQRPISSLVRHYPRTGIRLS